MFNRLFDGGRAAMGADLSGWGISDRYEAKGGDASARKSKVEVTVGLAKFP
jgi:hypothetical protein